MLVIDDSEPLANCLRRILRAHDVTIAHTGAEARALLGSAGVWDLILCDVLMPDVTGIELHAELQRTAPALAKQLVFMTGDTLSPKVVEFLASVPNRRLDKPFEAMALLGLLPP